MTFTVRTAPVGGEHAGGPRHVRGLYSRTLWLDDMTGGVHDLLNLVAPHVEEPGYDGHVREEFDGAPSVLSFRDGAFEPLSL